MTEPLFLPVADHAVMVEFATALNPTAHAAVLALDHALSAAPFPGFSEAVPAFVTLLVAFDPLITDHTTVEQHLRRLLATAKPAAITPATHTIPLTYDGPDMSEVCARTGLTAAEVESQHQSTLFTVAMYGFAPGYAYLSGLPATLGLDRKPKPVRDVPAGSIIIAGGQCLITTLTMPTGWWVIGHSPACILTEDPTHPFLFSVGDHVRFQAAL